MCGIVGYIGERNAVDVLIHGLRKLEYRGYDSAGVAVIQNGDFQIRRTEGKLAKLEALLEKEPINGNIGIGHTRWATHGRPSETNAHPHRAGDIILVHNGIIENHNELKARLAVQGHNFKSETDTEIVAHLIEQHIFDGKTFEQAAMVALDEIEGAYALGVAMKNEPDKLIAAKRSSPLIVGYGEGENFIASDVPAVLNFTKKVDFLRDGEMAVVTRQEIRITDAKRRPVKREPVAITWDPVAAEKGGHKHFMHKEIFEQPQAFINTIQGRMSLERGETILEDFKISDEHLAKCPRITIVACGTAWHAGLVGKFLIEGLTRIPVEVDLGSEYRYRDPLVVAGELMIVISQSGETADTLAALKEAKSRGAKVLAVCNAQQSSIARESDEVIYTLAGPEIGVASTKAFITQVAVLYLFAIHLARVRCTLDANKRRKLLEEIIKVPTQLNDILRKEGEIRLMAKEYRNMKGYLFLGRGINYPIALEGALKLKEISYLHAEGYPAGEMKHGPIALVDEEMLTVALAPKNATYEKMLSNIEEIRAREGKILAVAEWGDELLKGKVDSLFSIPPAHALIQPLLLVVPLQLFAYHIADLKGTDVDQPRNLAKSVTVE